MTLTNKFAELTPPDSLANVAGSYLRCTRTKQPLTRPANSPEFFPECLKDRQQLIRPVLVWSQYIED